MVQGLVELEGSPEVVVYGSVFENFGSSVESDMGYLRNRGIQRAYARLKGNLCTVNRKEYPDEETAYPEGSRIGI